MTITVSAECCHNALTTWNISGDWVNPENKFFLSFTDSTVGIWNWGDFLPYRVEKDIVISKKEDTIRDTSYGKILRIVVNEWDTLLRFQGIKDTLKINIIRDIWYTSEEQQKLYRLLPKNANMFDSILFVSTMCYGYCPAMRMMIHSDGRIFFHGKEYTEKQGYYSGILSKNLLESIINKFRQIDFNNIDSTYIAGYTDSQSRHLLLYREGKRQHIEVYGFEKEPVELDVFLRYLIEFYKLVDFKEVSPFKFMDIDNIFPMPPPIS